MVPRWRRTVRRHPSALTDTDAQGTVVPFARDNVSPRSGHGPGAWRRAAAKTFGELDEITTDLPPVQAPARAGAPLRPRPPDPGRAKAKAAFQRHLFTYAWVNGLLVAIWALTNFGGYFWPVWPMLGWGIGLASHAFSVYGPRADQDEQRPGGSG